MISIANKMKYRIYSFCSRLLLFATLSPRMRNEMLIKTASPQKQCVFFFLFSFPFACLSVYVFFLYRLRNVYLPKSRESHVSDVSVPVTLVANVDADSVDVLIVVSTFDMTDVPITIACTSHEPEKQRKVRMKCFIKILKFFVHSNEICSQTQALLYALYEIIETI